MVTNRSRLLSVGLLGFLLLIQSHIASAGGYFVLNLGEAKPEGIWYYWVYNDGPGQRLLTYSVGDSALNSRLDQIIASVGHEECAPRKKTLQCNVTKLATPALDPWEAPPRVGWLPYGPRTHAGSMSGQHGESVPPGASRNESGDVAEPVATL